MIWGTIIFGNTHLMLTTLPSEHPTSKGLGSSAGNKPWCAVLGNPKTVRGNGWVMKTSHEGGT